MGVPPNHPSDNVYFSTYGAVGIPHQTLRRRQETYRAPLKVGEWRVAWWLQFTLSELPIRKWQISYFWVIFL